MTALDVYLHGRRAGTLQRRSHAKLEFAYAGDWVEGESAAISLSLPVRAEPYGHDACAPFFEGLLPEGEFLKAIARTLHVSAGNPFQLLSAIGGECAGAVSVGPADGGPPGSVRTPIRWLSEQQLSELLAQLPQRPLLAALDEGEEGDGIRISLAGAQDKIGVLVRGGRIGLSRGIPPTTDILKAPIPGVADAIANEAFCLHLADKAGLDAAVAEPRAAASHEYLLVNRYDRDGEARDGRIHQEDLCQALGLVPAVKYESEGGPRVADCATLLRGVCSAPARDVIAFLDALLFNFLIANNDAHAKNYSLLLDGPESIRLAPLYDLISTVVFPGTDRKLAMKYGGENRAEYLRRRHLERLAGDLGVKPPLVLRRGRAIVERVETAVEEARRSLPRSFQDRAILDEITAIVAARGERLRRAIAEPT
jgi:serine/threonine-protein kinase HipA